VLVNGKNIGFVYMIKFVNYSRGGGYKFDRYGRPYKFYVGYTSRSIAVRYLEHILRINSGYLSRNYPDSSKMLVYVDIVDIKPYGWKYHPREYEIKRLSHKEKIELIKSESNKLISYVLILKPLIKDVTIVLSYNNDKLIIVNDGTVDYIKFNESVPVNFLDKDTGKIVVKNLSNYFVVTKRYIDKFVEKQCQNIR